MIDEWKNLRPIPKSREVQRESVTVSTGLGCVMALLFVLLGAFCVFKTETMNRNLPLLLGELMITFGLFDVIKGFRMKEYRHRETKLTSNGIVYMILGAVILFNRDEAYLLISSVWGSLGLLKGTEELNEALCDIAEGNHFLKSLLSAVLELLLGVLLLMETDKNLHHHIVLLGVELMFTGLKYLRNLLHEIKDREVYNSENNSLVSV